MSKQWRVGDWMDEIGSDLYAYLDLKNKEQWETTPAEMNMMYNSLKKKRDFHG